MKVVIEKRSRFDWLFNDIAEYEKGETRIDWTYRNIKSYLADKSPLICGKGSNHIWIKDKSDINTRLCIITV